MIQVGNAALTREHFDKVLEKGAKIELHPATIDRVRSAQEFLDQFSKNQVVYGVNTGFGPMAQYAVGEDKQITLQYNLIRSHCSGAGSPMSEADCRATLFARLNTLALGRSGVSFELLTFLVELLNRGIAPVMYSKGGVGASGDLVQLAHLALAVIGEGHVWLNGEIKPTSDVYQDKGLTPHKITGREGLALMNGTSAMTGIGMINTRLADRLVGLSIGASCLLNELVSSFDDHFSQELNQAKLHKGQQIIAQRMRTSLQDSKRIRSRALNYVKDGKTIGQKNKVQEFYSLRCVPQILGPVLDALNHTQKVLELEVNSVNDNPIVDLESQSVWHGGNFHGDYVSFEMDKLKLAITKLCMLSERQLNYTLNQALNDILPPFVNRGILGFNFGMQGLQFTATSTTAENQTLSSSMYVHSIPCNGDNQDIVSMGTNAALLTRRVIDNTFVVMAIELASLAEAVDCLDILPKLSSSSKQLYTLVRTKLKATKEDIVRHEQLAELGRSLKEINL